MICCDMKIGQTWLQHKNLDYSSCLNWHSCLTILLKLVLNDSWWWCRTMIISAQQFPSCRRVPLKGHLPETSTGYWVLKYLANSLSLFATCTISRFVRLNLLCCHDRNLALAVASVVGYRGWHPQVKLDQDTSSQWLNWTFYRSLSVIFSNSISQSTWLCRKQAWSLKAWGKSCAQPRSLFSVQSSCINDPLTLYVSNLSERWVLFMWSYQ